MKRRYKIVLAAELIFTMSVALILSGCKSNQSNTIQKPIQVISQAQDISSNHDNLISVSNNNFNYSIYTRHSIDLLLIASALYTDFHSKDILPNPDTRELYKKAKDYFVSYKNHPFIKEFGKYMNGDDINGNYMGILLCYTDFPELKQQYNYSKYLTKDVNDEKSVNEFLKELKDFYLDTKAENFFKDTDSSYDKLRTYLNENFKKSEMLSLIDDVLKYTNNKEKYYGNDKINYNTVLTLYRDKGSFFITKDTGETNFVSVQYGYASTMNTNDDFNINNIVQTSIHEYLHNFVNQPVENNSSLINQLSAGKNKRDYTSSSYRTFPWHRITDECFVRAIEGRIYKNRFGEERALNEIIDPETAHGFKQLKNVYKNLQEYEDNRKEYVSIDNFIPIVIKGMYN